MLRVSKKIIYKTIKERVEMFGKFISKGNKFNMNQCDYCKDKFDNGSIRERVHLFRCGHTTHVMCCVYDKEDIACLSFHDIHLLHHYPYGV